MKDQEYLTVGRILSPWGVKGQFKVEPMTDDPKRFRELREVLLELPDDITFYQVESVIFVKGDLPVLKLKGINSREEAQRLRGCYIKIHRKDAIKLPEGRYFICDIIGLTVENEFGESLGTVVDVLQTGANDVYIVKTPNKKEILIPAIKQVVKVIDLENGKMIIRPLEGMLND
ncbi:MAG: ribosome maturation factor RimM [Tepidanaerobacteraceae bacterium]|nr:16S rRNA processing protein RimM [Thermoanaerobacterales bacterium]